MTNQHDPLTPPNPNFPRRPKFFSTVSTAEEKATVQMPVVNGNRVSRLQFIVPGSEPLKHLVTQPPNETEQLKAGPSAMVARQGTSARLKTPGRWVPGSFGFDSNDDELEPVPTE